MSYVRSRGILLMKEKYCPGQWVCIIVGVWLIFMRIMLGTFHQSGYQDGVGELIG